jgi:hypothetical protein
MTDCPNCGASVEQGKIHPGRRDAAADDSFAGGEPSERPEDVEELPAEDTPVRDPRQFEGGL